MYANFLRKSPTDGSFKQKPDCTELLTWINNFNKAVGKGSKAQVDGFILLMMHSISPRVTSLNEQRDRYSCEVSLIECGSKSFLGFFFAYFW